MKTLHGHEAREKVWSLIKDIKFALMATYDEKGKHFHARPMMALEREFDGTLWFMTAKDSQKVDEIRSNPTSLLTYADPKSQNYVSISGHARIVDDRKKIDELWTEFARAWFPEGKDDPNITLVCFEAEEAEFWDSPASSVVNVYGYIKAMLTGKQPELGETGHADFIKPARAQMG